MVEALGAHVLKLVRVRIGPIRIGTLPIGKWRVADPRRGVSVQVTQGTEAGADRDER